MSKLREQIDTDYKYLPPKNAPISDEDIINDMKAVFDKLSLDKMSMAQYKNGGGKYDTRNICRRFGSWSKGMEIIGVNPGNVSEYSDEILFDNLLIIWEANGKQPVRRDLARSPSTISQTPYNRRFGSWSNALKSFIHYVNNTNSELTEKDESLVVERRKKRDPNNRERFLVLQRDNFSCVACGASPAKDGGKTKLEVDHIIPYSKGGETELNNLQTLCSVCNGGKGNMH